MTTARTESIQTAQYLYCANSPEVMAVTNAWYAVGVGASYNQLNLMSISGQNYICTSSAYTVIHQPTGITSTLWLKLVVNPLQQSTHQVLRQKEIMVQFIFTQICMGLQDVLQRFQLFPYL